MQPYTLLYILGSGHCGSTLLDLLLNGHSNILALGEITNLRKHLAVAKEARESPCDSFELFGPLHEKGRFKGNLIETEANSRMMNRTDRLVPDHAQAPLNTPLWRVVKQQYENASGTPFEQIDLVHDVRWKTIRSWQSKQIECWARHNEVLFSCLHKVSGARILTDASKSPHRLYLLQRSGLFNIKVIHLVRNGGAVVNSYLRKYGDFRIALRRWAAPALLAFYLRRKFTRNSWLQLHYEELATRPEETLKIVSDFIGVSFEPEMLAYRAKPYSGIGGNRMRESGDEHIFFDEGWKQELSYKYRIGFTLVGGWLNRLYGY